VDVIDLAPGLWIWRLEHPGWREGVDWQEVVTSVCVDAGDERWVLDPLLPPNDAPQVWDRFAERPPTAVAILLPDHMREAWDDQQTWSVDALGRRHTCRAFGPNAFDPGMGPPDTEVQRIVPGRELPGGLIPFRDPRGWHAAVASRTQDSRVRRWADRATGSAAGMDVAHTRGARPS
jgi:hypothetical protein